MLSFFFFLKLSGFSRICTILKTDCDEREYGLLQYVYGSFASKICTLAFLSPTLNRVHYFWKVKLEVLLPKLKWMGRSIVKDIMNAMF